MVRADPYQLIYIISNNPLESENPLSHPYTLTQNPMTPHTILCVPALNIEAVLQSSMRL